MWEMLSAWWQSPTPEVALAQFGPLLGAILAIASQFGRGGGEQQQPDFNLLEQLFPEIRDQLAFDRLANLRRTAATDPQLIQSLDPGLLSRMGVTDVQGLLQGAVPLAPAVNNLAFGLLPRFSRAVPGGTFAGTAAQQELLDAGPQTRFGRTGFEPTVPPTRVTFDTLRQTLQGEIDELQEQQRQRCEAKGSGFRWDPRLGCRREAMPRSQNPNPRRSPDGGE